VSSLCVTRVSISIRSHYVDFDLVLIYVFSFQLSTYLCVFDSILT